MATYKSIRYSPLIGPGQVLLKTVTASSSSDLQFTQGITSEYKEYLFVAAGFHPEESNKIPQFQVSTDGGSSYGVTATTAEVNYTDGVTSAIQTQLDAKLTSSSTLDGGTY